MTVRLGSLQTRAIVLDIEGTTTPATFVYEVLFPFARAHAAAFLEQHGDTPACRAAVAALRDEQSLDRTQGAAPPPDLLGYILWLTDRDRKSPGLKALQGLIWEDEYHSAALRGEVYPEVPPAFARWRAQGLGLYIYSSGSVLAQRLLFGSTRAGDLTTFLCGYFDTTTGPKTAPDSYRAIAERIGTAPHEILFVSDASAELDAARAAGMRTALCERGSAASSQSGAGHPIIRSFDEII